MGKSYCKECDSEINEDVDICPKCGKPINNEEENSDLNKIKNNNTISVEKKEINEKSSYKQTFTSKKKFLTLTVICVILFIIVVMTFGFPNITAEHKGEYNKDNSLFVYSLGAGEVCLIKAIMLILKITHIKTLQTKYYLISIETI